MLSSHSSRFFAPQRGKIFLGQAKRKKKRQKKKKKKLSKFFLFTQLFRKSGAVGSRDTNEGPKIGLAALLINFRVLNGTDR